MSYQERSEQIHRYLDDELTETEREEFEAHIAECTECLLHLQQLGRAIQQVTQLEWVSAPANFSDQLFAKLDLQQQPPARRWQVRAMKYTGLAAALVLVVGLAVMMTAPSQFALETKNPNQLAFEGNRVIVPAGSQYNGDINVQNGDVIVKGKVNGNVTAVNGKIYKEAGADISGSTDEVDAALEKFVYYLKQMWNGLTNNTTP